MKKFLALGFMVASAALANLASAQDQSGDAAALAQAVWQASGGENLSPPLASNLNWLCSLFGEPAIIGLTLGGCITLFFC